MPRLAELIRWLKGAPTECLRCRIKIRRSSKWTPVEIYPSAQPGALCRHCTNELRHKLGHASIFPRITSPADFEEVVLALEAAEDDPQLELDSVSQSDPDRVWTIVSAKCPTLTLPQLCQILYDFWSVRLSHRHLRKARALRCWWEATKATRFYSAPEGRRSFMALRLTALQKDVAVPITAYDTVTVVRTGQSTFKGCKVSHFGSRVDGLLPLKPNS